MGLLNFALLSKPRPEFTNWIRCESMTKVENYTTLPPKYLAEAVSHVKGQKVSTQALNKILATVGFQKKNPRGSGWLADNDKYCVQCGRSYKNGEQEAVQWLPEVLEHPSLMVKLSLSKNAAAAAVAEARLEVIAQQSTKDRRSDFHNRVK